MRNAHDRDDELPTVVRIPEPRDPERRQRAAIEAMDVLAPQAVRVANGTRTAELHLLIADAVMALEHDEPELALQILHGARADAMPRRGPGRSWT